MRSAVRLVVLDMAGTTVCDDGLVLESCVAAAAHVGLRVTREAINARMGGSKRGVFGELARAQLGPGGGCGSFVAVAAVSAAAASAVA